MYRVDNPQLFSRGPPPPRAPRYIAAPLRPTGYDQGILGRPAEHGRLKLDAEKQAVRGRGRRVCAAARHSTP